MQSKERTHSQANDHVRGYENSLILKLQANINNLTKLAQEADRKAKKCACPSCEKLALAAWERVEEAKEKLEAEKERQTPPQTNIQVYDDRQ